MNRIERLLVVMDPADGNDAVHRQPPLARALDIADQADCGIDLFTTCYDAAVTPSLFVAPEVIDNERQRQVDEKFQWLESIAGPLRSQGYRIATEASWSYPPAAEISRKALASDVDLIIKKPTGHNYHVGFLSNTDWDLIRDCPVACLFAREDTPHGAGHGILACIDPTREAENPGADEVVPETSLDYQVYESAQLLGKALHLPVEVINAFELPAAMQPQLSSYAPALAESTGSSVAFATQLNKPDYAARHGRLLRAFAEHFQFPAGEITVEHGRPADVICTSARERKSTLIVMGALERGRLERALLSVNAEPVLSNAPCDVLFIKPAEHSGGTENTTAPVINRCAPAAAGRAHKTFTKEGIAS
jgi:nucleotide-binding universal stress UspA family protein